MQRQAATENPLETQGSLRDRDFRIGEWLIQPRLNQLVRAGKAISVEPRVIEVLACLAEQPGEVLSKDEIIRCVWPDTFVTDDVLIRAISILRKAFGDNIKDPTFIRTIPRRGYQLVGPVEPAGNGTRYASACHPGCRRRLFGPPLRLEFGRGRRGPQTKLGNG